MKPSTPSLLLLHSVLLLLVPASLSAQHKLTPAGPAARTDMGISFTPNVGQIVDRDGRSRPDIRYISSTEGMTLFLADGHISYVFSQLEGDLEHHRHADGTYDAAHPEPTLSLHRIDLTFIGAAQPEIVVDMPGGSYTNYYLPHLPDGLTHVPSYGRVTYRNIYPEIDFVIRGSGTDMKYDFVVRPGGKVTDIRMRYAGATGQRIDHTGGLVTMTSLGSLEDEAPYTFQEMRSNDPLVQSTGRQEKITSSYRIADGVISFVVGAYDPQRTLVIDPTQKWSTYYGGSGNEEMNGGDVTEVDRSGNTLFTANTRSVNFPVSTGAFSSTMSGSTDAVVVKMNSAGSMLWATYYGGSADELAHGIVSDRDRNIFIAGHTFSTDFPVFNAHSSSYGGTRDAFAVKFDSAGVRKWATYYGGSGFDDSYGLAIDSSGNPAMIGTTSSTSGIVTPGAFQTTYAGNNSSNPDAFVVRFNSEGVRQWGTYAGGTGVEYGYGAATDKSDNINITGWTNSNNFPVTPGSFQTTQGGDYDAFVMQFNSAGVRQWGTFFGGPGRENHEPGGGVGFAAIATDADGNPIITGMTTGGMPVLTGTLQRAHGGGTYDVFIAKFDTRGARLWATYYGGSGNDIGQGIATNAANSVLVTGHTFSPNLPGVTADAYQPNKNGTTSTSDAFIIKIDGAGRAWQYATYYGGVGNDEGVGIGIDPFGSIVIGGTAAGGLPVSGDAWQTTYGGGTTDVFLAYFCDIDPVVIDTSGPATICEGDSVTLFVPPGYSSYLWQNRRDTAISTSNRITVRDTGDYWVRLTNGAGCMAYTDTIVVRRCATTAATLADAGGATTLKPAYPNPAGGPTSIEYEIATGGHVQLLLVDMFGRTTTLVDAALASGRHVATFDASTLPSGAYLCILQTRNHRHTRTMTITR